MGEFVGTVGGGQDLYCLSWSVTKPDGKDEGYGK